jgi:hypothetical protein
MNINRPDADPAMVGFTRGSGDGGVHADAAGLGVGHRQSMTDRHRGAGHEQRPGRDITHPEKHRDRQRDKKTGGARQPDHGVDADFWGQPRAQNRTDQETGHDHHEEQPEIRRWPLEHVDHHERQAAGKCHEQPDAKAGIAGVGQERRIFQQDRKCRAHFGEQISTAARPRRFAIAAHREYKRDNAHDGGENEHRLPAEELGKKPADQRREYGRQDNHRHHIADDPRRLFAAVDVAHDGAADDHAGGATGGLHHAAENQHFDVGRPEAQQAANDEDRQAEQQYRLASEPVGGGSVGDRRDRHRHQPQRQGQLANAAAAGKGALDLRQHRQQNMDRDRRQA